MSSIHGVLQAAVRIGTIGNDLATAAGMVIAKRMALGMAASLDPVRADHAEFGRMIPEKMEAFSAAGRIMLRKSSDAGEEISRYWSDAFITAARAAVAMTRCTSPVSLAQAQGTFAIAWLEQAAANFMAMGVLALGAQEAALVPIQQTIAANTVRLDR